MYSSEMNHLQKDAKVAVWFHWFMWFTTKTYFAYAVFQTEKPAVSIEIISVGNIHAVSTLASLPYGAPAMSVALDELRKTMGDAVTFKRTFLYDDRYETCAALTDNVDYLVSRYFYSRRSGQFNMTVFIGAGCTERRSMGKLISEWNTLMMIGGTGETEFRDKSRYSNVVLGGNNVIKSRMNAYEKLFLKYSWSSIYVLLDSSATPWHLNIVGGLDTTAFSIAHARTDLRNQGARNDLSVILKDIQNSARVIIFLGYPTEFRAFMLLAKAENMTNGDYVYIADEPFRHRTYYGNLTWMYGNRLDQEAAESFRSVFVITSARVESPRLQTLEIQLKAVSQRDFNFTYAPDEKLNLFTIATYECVGMFGVILKELLSSFSSSVDLNDGSAIGRMFWNRTFNLDTGVIQFDEVGERKQDMIVQHFQKDDIWPTAVLKLKLTGSAKDYETVIQVEWPGPFPPPNEPVCGYTGMKRTCLSRGSDWQTTAIACSVCAVGAVAICVAAIKTWFSGPSGHANRQSLVIDLKELHFLPCLTHTALVRDGYFSSFANSEHIRGRKTAKQP